jgi:hypothetical protein
MNLLTRGADQFTELELAQTEGHPTFANPSADQLINRRGRFSQVITDADAPAISPKNRRRQISRRLTASGPF